MKYLSFELYKKMYLIRTVEEKIRIHYPNNEIKTPVHLCIGEEAIAVGVCQALKKEDQVFGTYRNHGIYIAKTGDINNFFSELFGKNSTLAKGKAGSMHLMAPEKGLMATSAIVGTTIPIAVGAAFANRYKKNDKLVAVFFGDGAIDEGVFWESINFACLKKLPIMFIYEDNDYAIHSHIKERHSYQSITDIIVRFNCNVFESKTTDVEKIYNITKKAIKLHSKNKKPIFMHLKYYRYLQHVGVNQDFHFGYRSKKEYKKWLKVDPIDLQRKRLLKRSYKNEDIKKIEIKIQKQVDKSISLARNESFVALSELYKNVYYE